MSSSVSRARHRAATKPVTPLTSLAKTISNVDTRKGLAAAATTGIALSVIAVGSALADPSDIEQTEAAGATTTTLPAEIGDPVAQAHMEVASNPEITAPEGQWDQGTEVTLPQAATPRAHAAVNTTTDRAHGRAAVATSRATSSSSTSSVNVAPSVVGGSVLDIAMRYQGIPYRYGGTTPSGFDCSGFVQYVYRQAGIGLPRTSGAMRSSGQRISAGEAKPGDLVSYRGHVGIYAGNGKMIHSPKPGEAVRVQKIYGSPSFVRVG